MPEKQKIDAANADLYDGDPEGFDIYSWGPTPQADVEAGKPQAPSTQVHLYFNLPLSQELVRLGGGAAVSEKPCLRVRT